MTIIKFTLDSNELQFTVNPSYPLIKDIEKIQSTDRTASGKFKAETYNVTLRRFPLTWTNLPPADYSALVTWFDSVADGAANSFTYTDPDNVDYTVRIITKTLSFSRNANNYFSGSITMEEQ